MAYDTFDNMNIHLSTDTWEKCSHIFKIFESPEFSTGGISIIESEVHSGKFSIIKPDKSIVKDDLDNIKATSLMLLARYKLVLNTIMKRSFPTPQDFFNELEANREYHARQLLAVNTINTDEFKQGLLVTRYNATSLEDLDLLICHHNDKLNLNRQWLVNALMVHMAAWEIRAFRELFKEDYITAVISSNDIPSHLRVLSRTIDKKKEMVLEKYPESLLINYSNFYPDYLYHTGKQPLATKNMK
jgi:hypothetical protein